MLTMYMDACVTFSTNKMSYWETFSLSQKIKKVDLNKWQYIHTNKHYLAVEPGDGKSERWYSRNQQTTMDWNGWM